MPTMKDAQAFTQLFREKFSDKEFAEYRRFMYDFVNLRIDFQVFMDGVMDLMNGHAELIPEFHKFLPKRYARAYKQRLFFHSAKKFGDFSHDCNRNDELTMVACEDTFGGQEISSRNCESDGNQGKKYDIDPHCLPDTHYLYQFQKIGEKKSTVWGTNDYMIREAATTEFFSRIKQRLGDDIYNSFWQSLSVLKVRKRGDIDRWSEQVLELFKDQPELQTDFSVLIIDMYKQLEDILLVKKTKLQHLCQQQAVMITEETENID